ncbi:tyrosine-protein kinase Btk-like isoform X2 [Tubulanus polymorphus]
MRSEWTCILRKYCQEDGATLMPQYHPGIYNKTTGFSCCSDLSKTSGCTDSTAIDERLNKSTNGSTTAPVGTAPNSAENEDKENKMVVAMYDHEAVSPGDLSLVKGEEYLILHEDNENWWFAEASDGSKGYIPANYVRPLEGMDKFSWYFKGVSRSVCEEILLKDGREGSFLVRDSSTRGTYTLSLLTMERRGGLVRHYHIKRNEAGQLYFSANHVFTSIPEVIRYHMHNAGGLVIRLKHVPGNRAQPATAGLGHDMTIINPQEITFGEELGRGQFGVVYKGMIRGRPVAIKTLHADKMSEDEFIAEAQTMSQLNHRFLVQLYGVSPRNPTTPMYIVTEFLAHGALLSYLRKRRSKGLLQKTNLLLEMCVQVACAMEYLESRSFIHRDLAARNCLVSDRKEVKVGDFGLARYVLDDQYTSSLGSKFPVKWAAPEVLNYYKFSSKSDVWSFGVLMWEIFSGGETPYANMPNKDISDYINGGSKLQRPASCPPHIFQQFMLDCWHRVPERRPSFYKLRESIELLLERDYRDYQD